MLARGAYIAAHWRDDVLTHPAQLVVFEDLCERGHVVTASPASRPPTTLRRATHVRGPGLPKCHTLFDPLGLGFEHYDEARRYREEVGLPIDSSGSLKDGGTGLFTFSGLDELSQHLSEQEKVGLCSLADSASASIPAVPRQFPLATTGGRDDTKNVGR